MSEEKRTERVGYIPQLHSFFVPDGYDGCRNCAKRDEQDEACKHAAELRKQCPVCPLWFKEA